MKLQNLPRIRNLVARAVGIHHQIETFDVEPRVEGGNERIEIGIGGAYARLYSDAGRNTAREALLAELHATMAQLEDLGVTESIDELRQHALAHSDTYRDAEPQRD